MKRSEIKELDLTQTDPHPDPICVQNCVQIEHHLQISVCQWDRDCVKGNHTVPTIKLTSRQSRGTSSDLFEDLNKSSTKSEDCL